MSISLYKSALPSTVNINKEGKSFFEEMKLPKGGKPEHYGASYTKNIVLAKLVIEICCEAAEAIIDHQYKKFDALVKNYGCQITALEVQQKLQGSAIFDEAERVRKVALTMLQQVEEHLKKNPIGLPQMGVIEYLAEKAKVDFEISEDLAQLVRFRILNIINTDVLINDVEVPCTKIEKISAMVEKIDRSVKIPIKAWIESLQAEESGKAVRFIQEVAQKDTTSRGVFVHRCKG
ncbi:MAG: hypothetical protein H0U49_05340 [Parachlamydiaceae bacterium]|nr:hypothetical protein [Parachlamydiaceae bacterium]